MKLFFNDIANFFPNFIIFFKNHFFFYKKYRHLASSKSLLCILYLGWDMQKGLILTKFETNEIFKYCLPKGSLLDITILLMLMLFIEMDLC